MGFSHSKLEKNLCLDKHLPGQFSLKKAIKLLLDLSDSRFHNPFNLATKVKGFFRVFETFTLSSFLCSMSFLPRIGRRFIHSNQTSTTDSKQGFISIPEQALILHHQLAGQLAKLRSPWSKILDAWLKSDYYRGSDFFARLRFQFLANENKGDILSPTDPRSVRVQSILRDIVQGIHDSSLEDCYVSVYDPADDPDPAESSHWILKVIGSFLYDGSKVIGSFLFDGQKAIYDRMKAIYDKKDSQQPAGALVVSGHACNDSSLKYNVGIIPLLRSNWKVMVIDSCFVEYAEAYYLPHGRIVIYNNFPDTSDSDIAFALANGVAHGVFDCSSLPNFLALFLFMKSFMVLSFKDLYRESVRFRIKSFFHQLSLFSFSADLANFSFLATIRRKIPEVDYEIMKKALEIYEQAKN